MCVCVGGGDPLKTQTVCQVHLRFCLNGSTSKRNSEPIRSTLTNHCQSFPLCATALEISVSLLDLDGSVITVSSERQHQFHTVEFRSRGRLIAQLCPLATFALHYLKSLSIVRYMSKQTSLGTVNAGLSDSAGSGGGRG